MGVLHQKRRKLARAGQSGNVFFALFAAVAMLGAVGVVYTTILKGSAKGVTNVTRSTSAEADIFAAANTVGAASVQNQSNKGDCDADMYAEPLPWTPATGSTPYPAGGGLLPANLSVRMSDAWGTQFGYCDWDHGPQTVTDNVAACGGSGAKRLKGANSKINTAIAVIAAGPDKIFQTKCNAFVDANADGQPDVPLVQKTPGSDDVVVSFTYAEAFDATKGASSRGLDSLPDSACTPDKVGIMRYNMDVAQVCQADGWHEIGAQADTTAPTFTPTVNGILSTLYTSNAIGFSGFFGTRTATVDNGGTIILNGVPAGSSASVKVGDTVAIRGISALLPEITNTYTLSISSIKRPWTLTTRNKNPPVLVITPSSTTGMYVTSTNPVGTSTLGSTVTLTVKNTSEADAGPVSFAFTGSTPSNFAVQSNGCAAGVAGYNGTCTVTVYPTATSTLTLSATITASASGATSGSATLAGDSLFPITLTSVGTGINLQTIPEMSGGFATSRWAANRPKIFIIDAGTTIGSSSSATPALQTGTGWGGSLSIINSGNIQGAGGQPNSGAGGTAFLANASGATLTNTSTGKIWGGGGSGGAGGNGGTGYYTYEYYEPGGTDPNQWVYNGSQKYDFDESVWFGPGAIARVFWGGEIWESCQNCYSYSNWPWEINIGGWLYTRGYEVDHGNQLWTIHRHQTQGGYTGGAAGGNGGRGQGYDGANTGGNGGGNNGNNSGIGGTGGTGGAWGMAGSAGGTGASGNAAGGGAGGAGGAAGYAVKGTVTFNNSGQTLGTVGP